jgi:hypothetical protein
MALTPVNRHLGLFGLVMPLLGCTDGVELLSSDPGGSSLRSPVPLQAAGGIGLPPSTGSGGATGLGGDGGRSAAVDPIAASGGYPLDAGAGSGGKPDEVACRIDADCARGQQAGTLSPWCEGGACVPCHVELPACERGWSATGFARNGCMQLVCAPPSACHSSSECGGTKICYAGATCGEGCTAGDPQCCEGNFCALPGCDGAVVPLSCTAHGCPLGERCVGTDDWSPPDCDCAGSGWVCRTTPPASQCQ